MNTEQKSFSINIVLITAIIFIVTIIYFVLTKNTPPDKQQSSTPAITSISTQKLEWKTYTNNKYNFSVKYPCDVKCQSSPPNQHKNAYVENEIYLPTTTNARVLFFTFTNDSVDKWNKAIEGPGTPFPFSLPSIQNALKLPVGSTCKISSYYAHSNSTYICKIVLIGGEKAVQFINGIPRADYPNKNYIQSRGENKWLEITEVYSTSVPSNDFLNDRSQATPEIRKQIDAILVVIKTINF